MKRPAAVLLVLLCALAATGCGKEHGPSGVTVAETEGIYLDVDGAKYQIQMSRQLNPADVEDENYLSGLPEGIAAPKGDETWFGIWLRVENVSEKPVLAAREFEIEDTEERTYRPIPFDAEENPLVYSPATLPPGGLIPDPDSVAGQGPTQGSLVLFKLPIEAFANRPLVFKILGETGEAEVDIDL